MENINWYDILILVGVPSIITVVFQTIWMRIMKKQDSRFQKKNDEIEKRNADGVLIKNGIQALLRHELLSDYEKFNRNGYCQTDDKATFEHMYECYHSLGKNGVMDDIYKKVISMPTERPNKSRKNKH